MYRGVVPIRFGADALGGVVHLVTNQYAHSSLNASYQVGSFGTQRGTLNGRYRHEPTGLVIGGSASFDASENNYRVDVEASAPNGKLQPVTVRRFHDGYRAAGGQLDIGVVDKPWAKRLSLTGFVSSFGVRWSSGSRSPTMTCESRPHPSSRCEPVTECL